MDGVMKLWKHMAWHNILPKVEGNVPALEAWISILKPSIFILFYVGEGGGFNFDFYKNYLSGRSKSFCSSKTSPFYSTTTQTARSKVV